MKILITGGTGFVGTQLTTRFIQDGHSVTILTRSLKGVKESPPGISYLEGDPTKKGPWQEAIQNHDTMINLAGASIFSKWTDEHKNAIRESRVSTTQNIVEGIPSHPSKKITLFSTSAVGYYGFCGDEELVEDSSPGDDFLARIAKEWEGEALKAREKGARVVITRFGISKTCLDQMGCGGKATHPSANDNGIPMLPHIRRHIIGFHMEQVVGFFPTVQNGWETGSFLMPAIRYTWFLN